MNKIKIKSNNPVIKYIRSLQYKDYVTDLKYNDLENISFAVINREGVKQDVIKIVINKDMFYENKLYRYSIYKGDSLLIENKKPLEIVRLVKNYLIKFEKSIYSRYLEVDGKKLNLYAYAERVCRKANVEFNIPIEFLDSDLNAISFVVSDCYAIKSLVFSDTFIKNNDIKFVLNVFKLQILRFIVHEKRKPYQNSKDYFKNLMTKHNLFEYKTYAKIRKVS